MEQGKIRPSVTLYSLDRSLSTSVWLIKSAAPTHTPILVELANKWTIISLWLCIVSLFVHTPRKKTWRFARPLAQNAWNQAKMCLLGVSSKNCHHHSHYPPYSEKFALRKHFFAQNTYKSWRKRHQNSYMNRKQLMRISNLGLKIWPEVEFWLFLRTRSRKLAKNTWNRGGRPTGMSEGFKFCPWTSTTDPEILPTPPLIFPGVKKFEIWRRFQHQSNLSRTRLKMQQGIRTLKQKFNVAMIAVCPRQV